MPKRKKDTKKQLSKYLELLAYITTITSGIVTMVIAILSYLK